MGLFGKLFSQAARKYVAHELSGEVNKLQRAELMGQLSRSKIYTFEEQPPHGIVLTGCVKEHDVKDLTVPDVVQRIGKGAFEGCEFLRSITIPPSVEVIEPNAFRGCKNLKTVRFSGGLMMIGTRAFEGCGITEADLPEGLVILGDRAFYNCTELRRARVPESVKSFQNGVFYGCEGLKEVALPRVMHGTICNVFAHCKSLKTLIIPYGIKSLADWCMEYCDSLTDVYIPDTVTKICNRAFLYCKSLKYIYIPDSVREIEVAAVFSGCSSLEKVRLPIGIRFTPRFDKDFDRVFYNCDKLRTVVLGNHSFKVDAPPDENSLILMHTELALMGNPTARDYICDSLGEVMRLLADRGDIALTERLLGSERVMAGLRGAKQLDTAIDYAAEKGAHEIYLMLVQYKQSRFGFENVGDRFAL